MAEVGDFVARLKFLFDGTGIQSASDALNGLTAHGSILDGVMSHFVFTMDDVINMAKKIPAVFADIVNKAAEEELNLTRLSAAMKAQGIYSEESYASNIDFAQSLSTITGVSRDTILQVERLLTNFGLHDTEMHKATESSINLASRTGDVESAAMMLGRAYEGMTGRLKQYSINIDQGVSGHEALEQAMKQVNAQYSGTMQAELTTYSGKLKQFNNILTEVEENIGKGWLPTLSKGLEFLNDIVIMYGNTGTAATKNGQIILSQEKLLAQSKIELSNLAAIYSGLNNKAEQEESKNLVNRIATIQKSIDYYKKLEAQSVKNSDTNGKLSNEEIARMQREQDARDEELKKQMKAEDEKQKKAADTNIKLITLDSIQNKYSTDQQIELLEDFRSKCDAKSLAYAEYTKRITTLDEERYKKVWEYESKLESDFAGGIKEMLDGSKNFGDALLDVWKNITSQILELIAQIIAKWLIMNAITGGAFGFGSAIHGVLGFDEGGTVPGPIGSPQLIMAHGGETILPTHKGVVSMSTVSNMSDTTQQSPTVINIYGNVDKANITDLCNQMADALKQKDTGAVRLAKVVTKEGTARNGEAV